MPIPALDLPFVFKTLIPLIFFVLASVAFTVFELVRPLRHQSYRDGLAVNALGLTWAWIASGTVISGVETLLIPLEAYRPHVGIMSPLARVVVFFILSDFFRFVAHWLMHYKLFWPMHQFHHSVHVLHWFSGNRASVLHVAMFMAPMAVCAWFLQVGQIAMTANVLIMILWNHLMHTNVRMAPSLQRALEWVVTTPRYHHIHHSEDAQHRGVNLGSILTLWDRLWRTYMDPDQVDASRLRFGSEDTAFKPLWRDLIGA